MPPLVLPVVVVLETTEPVQEIKLARTVSVAQERKAEPKERPRGTHLRLSILTPRVHSTTNNAVEETSVKATQRKCKGLPSRGAARKRLQRAQFEVEGNATLKTGPSAPVDPQVLSSPTT
jgi:hypothetical protein